MAINPRLRYLLILQKNALLRQAYKLRDVIPDAPRRTARNLVFRYCGGLFADLPAYQKWQVNPDMPSHGPEHYPDPDARADILARHYPTATQALATPAMLFISHDRGGGTETHLQTLAQQVEQEGCKVYVLRGISTTRMRLSALDDIPKANLTFDADDSSDALLTTLRALNIRHIHIHHTLDLTQSVLESIPQLAGDLQAAYDVTAHDYFTICPRFALFDEAVQAYCGEPVVQKCTLCVGTYGSAMGKDIDVEAWRLRYSRILEGARRVFTPSADVKQRLAKYFPQVTCEVRPHPDTVPTSIPAPVTRQPGEPLQVVMLGAIAPYKGSQTLLRMVADAQERDLAIHYTIIGHTDIDWQLSRYKNVTITGSYQPETLSQRIREGSFHLALFLNVIPETYSFTLSEVLRDGLFPVAFDIGAIAERLRALEWGSLMPLTASLDASRLNDHLLALTPTPAPAERILTHFAVYKPFLPSYYGLELSSLTLTPEQHHDHAIA